MRYSRSMENLQILPEEAKIAASLLRLTISEKQESPCEFQTYICKHSQFPYHRSLQKSTSAPSQISISELKNKTIVTEPEPERKRCNSFPLSISDRRDMSCRQSNSNENQGFFSRLFQSLRRKSQAIQKTPDLVEAGKMEEEHGDVVRQFTRISTNMDHLLFMSLR